MRPGWLQGCGIWSYLGGFLLLVRRGTSQGKTSKPTREQTGKGKWALWAIPCFKVQSHRITEQSELEEPLKISSPIPALSRTWTTWACSEPCPMWPPSGFSVQRGWGKPFQREESILCSCQTLGCCIQPGWSKTRFDLFLVTVLVLIHAVIWRLPLPLWLSLHVLHSQIFPSLTLPQCAPQLPFVWDISLSLQGLGNTCMEFSRMM